MRVVIAEDSAVIRAGLAEKILPAAHTPLLGRKSNHVLEMAR